MTYKFYSFLLLLSISSGCKKSVQTPSVAAKKSDIAVVTKHKTHSKLSESSNKMIADWKEYETINELISNYENISPEEALGNVYELQLTVKQLKDSLNIKSLKTPAFRSRLHVLENEILRLSDMSSIPSITSFEVNNQINKMLLVFGSLNDKINTVYSQEQFNKEINLDDFFILERDSIAKTKEFKSPKKINKSTKSKARSTLTKD